MTREEVDAKIDNLSRFLTYPELDDLHALNDNDAEQRVLIERLDQFTKMQDCGFRSLHKKIIQKDAEIAALKAQLATAKRGQDLLRELRAVVKGECPSLLNEDSGGDSKLDMEIEDLLTKEHP